MELALYLLPVTLGDTPIETVLPPYNKEIILGIRYFIVEDVRSARRFLKKVDKGIDIDALTFYTLNKHTSPEDISGYLKPLVEGHPMGVISEAGCPAVADPGADVVAIAQRKNLRVVPLGPWPRPGPRGQDQRPLPLPPDSGGTKYKGNSRHGGPSGPLCANRQGKQGGVRLGGREPTGLRRKHHGPAQDFDGWRPCPAQDVPPGHQL